MSHNSNQNFQISLLIERSKNFAQLYDQVQQICNIKFWLLNEKINFNGSAHVQQ